MYWRDVITLEAVQHGTDAEGYPTETVEATQVFADVQSTKRSEFYKAKQIGIDLAITVKLRAADYGGQERLVWNGKRYKVERAYTEAREMYELNCSEYREAADNEHKHSMIPADFGDDDAGHYLALVQVHLYAPHEKNTVKLRREISRRLVSVGFTRPSITPASDERGQHYVFECESAEAVEEAE